MSKSVKVMVLMVLWIAVISQLGLAPSKFDTSDHQFSYLLYCEVGMALQDDSKIIACVTEWPFWLHKTWMDVTDSKTVRICSDLRMELFLLNNAAGCKIILSHTVVQKKAKRYGCEFVEQLNLWALNKTNEWKRLGCEYKSSGREWEIMEQCREISIYLSIKIPTNKLRSWNLVFFYLCTCY